MLIKRFKKFALLITFSIILLSGAKAVQAASLFFSPASGSQSIGKTFYTSVFVSSSDQAMNAASGIISFPSNLEVVSLSKASSIFSLWPQEPSYSNSARTINFEGIVLNPGYTGQTGKILTIGFKAKSSGSAGLSFSSGAILANDGRGTNILTSMGQANFSIGSALISTPRSVSTTISANTLPTPKVSSDSHPDTNQWYSTTTAKLSWKLPAGTTGARLLLDKKQTSIPTISYIPAIDKKEISDLSDGVWYFHIRLRNNAGWGAATHFRIQIDSTKPELFEIEKLSVDDFTKPRALFAFNFQDEHSGFDRCEVKIDDQNMSIWRDSGDHIYETGLLGPGNHTLTVKAFDSAGNFKEGLAEFSIEPIETPEITDYPRELNADEKLSIRGKTYPESQINVFIQKDGSKINSYQATSNASGEFVFVSEKGLKEGLHTLWLEAVDQRGAKSLETEKISIIINQSSLMKALTLIMKVLAITVPIIALVWLIIYLILIFWKKIFLFRRTLRKEVRDVESVVDESFDNLRQSIKESLVLLEETSKRRHLTREEIKIFNQLKKGLTSAKRKIRREIKDIKEELGE